jgi:hypothetical protein
MKLEVKVLLICGYRGTLSTLSFARELDALARGLILSKAY